MQLLRRCQVNTAPQMECRWKSVIFHIFQSKEGRRPEGKAHLKNSERIYQTGPSILVIITVKLLKWFPVFVPPLLPWKTLIDEVTA